MAYPYFDLVQRAYGELISEGLIKRRADPEQVEEDKGLLTQRSGYYSNTEGDPGIGVLSKPVGNNYKGYSVDILLHKDGRFWDIVTDQNGMAVPVDGEEHNDPSLGQRWAQPTAELAQISDTPGPGPGPDPSPDVDEISATLDEIIDMLHRAQEVQARDTAAIIARSDLNTQRIMDRIEEVVNNAEESGKKILAMWLAMQQNPDAPPVLPDFPGDGSNVGLALLLKLLVNRPERA
jgi:hypothetical protein